MAVVAPGDHDALVGTGGTINADALRRDAHAQRVVRVCAQASRPVATVCHGPWLLITSGLASEFVKAGEAGGC